ncbi:thioesterase family protein [Enterococcus sp. AZ103]|uniref:thioesterase family protein n=1 Tax=Enterococcus sp. AZ103 TaxID=2774628 RepID=UPI003F28C037
MEKLTKEFVVSAVDTAEKLGSGDLAVLATPRLVAMMENTAKNMLDLASNMTSVGFIMEMKHLAPSPVGAQIIVTAEILERGERTVDFTLSAYAGDTLIATANHQRVIVNRLKFMEKIQNKPIM